MIWFYLHVTQILTFLEIKKNIYTQTILLNNFNQNKGLIKSPNVQMNKNKII